MNNLPYAEDVRCWKTSKTSPDGWIEKTKKKIVQHGGKVLREAFGTDNTTGTAAFMLEFELQGDHFRQVWPVLPTRKAGQHVDAKRQAATLLFHHVEASLVSAQVIGARAAFFEALLLPDGRTAGQASMPELIEHVPAMIAYPVLPPPPDAQVVG